MNHESSWEKSQIEKQNSNKISKLCYTTCKKKLSVYVDEELLEFSWRISLLYINQSINLQNRWMDWFLCDTILRHESVNGLKLACIHWDIFLDYDKIIDVYTSKYQRRMPLINPLSKNHSPETVWKHGLYLAEFWY